MPAIRLDSSSFSAASEISANAGIEREVKLFLPLTGERQSMLSRCAERSEIRLSYFKGRKVKLLACSLLRELGRLVSDSECFTTAELARASVKRAGTRASPRYSLTLTKIRPTNSRVTLQSFSLPISRAAAKRLNRLVNGHRRAKFILEQCGPVLIGGKRVRPEDFTSARLRSVARAGGASEFYVDFKGKRHGSHRISRAELSIPITAQQYARLLGSADGGTISKTRYHQHGAVRIGDGTLVQVEAEIDVLRGAGGSFRSRKTRPGSLAESIGVPEFALVEIELPQGISRNGLIKALATQAHSLPILRGPSHSLSFKNKSEWQALGMRTLALEGLNSDACGQLTMLRKRCGLNDRPAKKVA